MTDMLQKTENVAKNVANENSQDLTEQMHKCELPEGWYWVKDDEGQIKLAEYSAYCIDRETNETEYDWSCLDEIEQVLAPVPSYEEWQDLKSKLQLKETAYDFDTACLEEENTQLKELLRDVKDYLPEFETPMDILAKIDEILQ